MGFGYNPNLIRFGERLDILNFYYWIKELEKKVQCESIIYDASGYYIVNKIPQRKIKKLGKYPFAKQILEIIIEEQERPKRKEILENCGMRSKYLEKFMELFQINGRYIDSRKVFREEIEYEKALEISLEFVKKLQKEDPELISQIEPNNINPASKLYLPLEIAEAVYLENKFKVRCKFGPEKEEFFDKAILRLLKEKNIPYQTIRCSSGPRKPGYLSDKNVIWGVSRDYFVYDILQYDKEYKKFVEQYLSPLKQKNESIDQTALRIKSQLKPEEIY